MKIKYLILATKASLNAKINEVNSETPSSTSLATKTTLKAKINEVKGKIPNITNLATTTALTAVENKVPSVSNLVKKTDCNTKIMEITDHNHEKYITTAEFDKLTEESFYLGLKRTNSARKSNIANFAKKTGFDEKLKHVRSNKNELNELSKKVKKISTKGLTKDLIDKFSILNGAKYFSLGVFENYLVFIPDKKYIKHFTGTTWAETSKFNGMSEESIENITKLDSNFALTFVDHHFLPDMNFNEHCLIKNNISMPKKVINLFISYTVGLQLKNFTLGNCLFGCEKVTKNADQDKYKYTGYGIGFVSRS